MSGLFSFFPRLFARRLRGFRVVDLCALACLVVLATGVYAFKADAGRESARIKDVDLAIAEQNRQVRLLQAEIAHLEQPERLERLSGGYLGLRPADARREAPVEGLGELAHRVEPAHLPTQAATAEAPR
ncbi:cell division protein FtsL [soil metagenome]